MSKEIHKPGDTCPKSGQYAVVTVSTGRQIGVERTVVNGHTFPPTRPADREPPKFGGE
jgi:hypothetical protein